MKPQRPADVPIEQALMFLDGVIESPAARVLEVGCGDGALAARLQECGLSVTALDRSAEAVRIARGRGLKAVESDFFDYREGTFDVVLFTRSLHHLELPARALDHARSLLEPRGLVIAEEFAIEHMDRDTARWFFELRSLLEAAAMLPPEESTELAASNPLERWYALHAAEQPLHSGEDMLLAMGSRLEMIDHRRVPYLYRSICDRIEESDRGIRVGQWVLELESLRISERTLRPVGLRMTARV